VIAQKKKKKKKKSLNIAGPVKSHFFGLDTFFLKSNEPKQK
jgi:hypothetical protein